MAGGDGSILAVQLDGPGTGTSEVGLITESAKEQSPRAASSLALPPLRRSPEQTAPSESSSRLHESETGEALTRR